MCLYVSVLFLPAVDSLSVERSILSGLAVSILKSWQDDNYVIITFSLNSSVMLKRRLTDGDAAVLGKCRVRVQYLSSNR